MAVDIVATLANPCDSLLCVFCTSGEERWQTSNDAEMILRLVTSALHDKKFNHCVKRASALGSD